MADSRRYGLNTQLDIEQILVEAQNRWLRPAEICEILKNYRKFRIAPEPPNKPPCGSLFLFDRKVLRYFRKDGHNWRKKKDGKTVKEAHERLKDGSVDVLHCYYAHGEENENFQRRSYWMLEEDFMHIVLVHYLEVKGNKTNYSRARDSEENSQSPPVDSSPVNCIFFPNNNQVHSQTTDTSSLNSGQMSEYEDTESDNHQASSRYHSFVEVQQSEDGPVMNQMDMGLLNACFPAQWPGGYQGKQPNIPGLDFVSFSQGIPSRTISDIGFGLTVNEPRKQIDVTSSWEEVFNHCTMGLESVPLHSIRSANVEGLPQQEIVKLGQLSVDELSVKPEAGLVPRSEIKWQIDVGGGSSILSAWPMDQKVQIESTEDLGIKFQGPRDPYMDHNGPEALSLSSNQQNGSPLPPVLRKHLITSDAGPLAKSNVSEEEQEGSREGKINFASTTKHSLIDICKTEDLGLKKHDSFSRWMSRELGEVDDTKIQSTSGDIWTTDENGNVIEDSTISPQVQMDGCLLGPSLAQDQLFSIDDFSPNWAYSGLETKVLIMGTFLKNQHELQNCTWSCMFGELEVPAEILGDGVLRCIAPIHNAGRVPFYVTCSNRLACSEVREFEYWFQPPEAMDMQVTSELLLRLRLGKLLSLDSVERPEPPFSTVVERVHVNNKISSLLREDENEWSHMLNLTAGENFSVDKVKEQLLQKLLKENLCTWLIVKAAEDGKGPNVLDKEGQGVIHLVAALDYDWAIAPTVAAGVNINFRDANGWTALHWAASYGRERTVAVLVSLSGEPGALTDPTPQFPSGRTPADLASSNGHKGIAGYLAEFHLTSHLEKLTIKEKTEDVQESESSDPKAVQTIAARTATQYNEGDVPEGLSLKDSLTAVRNAAQAAARIHEVFRVHSFHRKQLIEYGDKKVGISDERALSLISVKSQRAGHHDEPVHTAAIRIQNKFRGWKGRKEFLIIRQRIVKIQALVRGHQVRKHFRKIIWSVGIVEKAILRWRRKRSGLRGFRSEALIEGTPMQIGPSTEDDYDFLQEGRKQTEARMEKALARVRSMVQYPEARDQYRRLLNVVTEIQETRVLVNDSIEAAEGDVLFDLETLLGDDTYMPTAT
ncbi:calmodulin-binding transcription activator 3-like isoform X2 [Aristolochia californica]|uniref:calmodulin-binding transcription activator 3-like isoform X2 n=1 Tax=Aristolochia californica TaxID=171875 RepID=UPI0035E16D39